MIATLVLYLVFGGVMSGFLIEATTDEEMRDALLIAALWPAFVTQVIVLKLRGK